MGHFKTQTEEQVVEEMLNEFSHNYNDYMANRRMTANNASIDDDDFRPRFESINNPDKLFNSILGEPKEKEGSDNQNRRKTYRNVVTNSKSNKSLEKLILLYYLSCLLMANDQKKAQLMIERYKNEFSYQCVKTVD